MGIDRFKAYTLVFWYLFSLWRKVHIFSFGKGETCSFLVRTRKERKETASLRLDRLCGWQRFGGGYKRRHPRSLRSRDPSIAAMFVNIAPEGAHTARALRLRAGFPVARTSRTGEVALQCGALHCGAIDFRTTL